MLVIQAIATSRGFPEELGKHPSNVSYEKKMAAPMTITPLKVTNLQHFMFSDCYYYFLLLTVR